MSARGRRAASRDGLVCDEGQMGTVGGSSVPNLGNCRIGIIALGYVGRPRAVEIRQGADHDRRLQARRSRAIDRGQRERRQAPQEGRRGRDRVRRVPSGCTEEVCIRILERINPGVKQHRPATIDKVTAGTHQEFRTDGKQRVRGLCRKNHVLYDIKRSFPAAEVDGRP